MRESPAVVLMERLMEKGTETAYVILHALPLPSLRKHAFDLSCVDLSIETIKQIDCVAITADHDEVDHEMVRQDVRMMDDTCGVCHEPENIF